eukprot:TRINITY_DN15503_c0_g1_i2.p1 TRINITY_DN15503_c0_g1~~TRINITY_DN15503_c0_g1_i2.p1  ORF type:complete len:219 (+),score=47.49 TRINITY_DN15503_c0_g1_i2:66-722(+)
MSIRQVVSRALTRSRLASSITAAKRTVIAMDGVDDSDRQWWEWHIPTRQHKGGKTTVLYLDGVGKFTWKMLIEKEIFTIDDLAKASDDMIFDLERAGCLHVNVAKEHAKVFMKTMGERERELQMQQTSWDKEVERLLEEREKIAEANRVKWEKSNQNYSELRKAAMDEQREQVKLAVEAHDFGPGKLRHQESRFQQEMGSEIDAEVVDDEPHQGNPFK